MSTPRRVTVVTPRARMDVGLPAECTVAELVPQLVRLAGAPAQPGSDGTGWVLSRVGESPFAPGITVSAASLRDGEILNLRPRPRYEPPLLYDDVVDAIASAAQSRRGAWRPRVGRRLGITAATMLFVGTALLVVAATAGRPQAAVGCGLLALALLVVAGALARTAGDGAAATACGCAGTVTVLIAGFTALPPHSLVPRVDSIAVALGAVTLYAAVAAALVAHRLGWFVATSVAAAAGALVAAVVLLFDVTPRDAAGVAVIVVTAMTAVAPMVSMRLARLPLPHVPADMESFREDERPALGSEVLGVTAAAAEILTGLVAALGAVAIGCCVVLLGEPSSLWPSVLLGLVGVAWTLRSRSYAGAAQRVVPVVVGLVVLAGLGYRLTTTLSADWLLAVAAAVALAAGLCLFYASRVVRNVHSPFRARWLDWLEYLVLISFVPVAGAVVGIYNGVRDAVG